MLAISKPSNEQNDFQVTVGALALLMEQKSLLCVSGGLIENIFCH